MHVTTSIFLLRVIDKRVHIALQRLVAARGVGVETTPRVHCDGGRLLHCLHKERPSARTTPRLPYRVRNATVTGSRAAWMAGRRPPAAPMLSDHQRPCSSRPGVTRKSNATCEKVLKLSVDREVPSQYR